MPYIKTIPPAEATGKLKEVMKPAVVLRRREGRWRWCAKCRACNPDALAAWSDLGAAIMHGPSHLTRRQREMIATVVSATNHCSY